MVERSYPARNRRFRAVHSTPRELGSDFLRARPVGPSELRSRAARAHGNRPQSFGPRRNSHAHSPFGATKQPFFLRKKYPLSALRAEKIAPMGLKSFSFAEKIPPMGWISGKLGPRIPEILPIMAQYPGNLSEKIDHTSIRNARNPAKTARFLTK